METIFGIRSKTDGKIYKDGIEISIRSPEDAIKNHIGMLTEDRRGNGIIGILSVKMNSVLANLKNYGFPVKAKKMDADTKLYIERLGIKTPAMASLIQNLSGGNQQKVLLARWLLTDPDILIVDEPTRGIDVGAKTEIHNIISELAAMGKAIIVISSELPEVMGIADRVVVMRESKVTGIIKRSEMTQEIIMKYATLDTETQAEA